MSQVTGEVLSALEREMAIQNTIKDIHIADTDAELVELMKLTPDQYAMRSETSDDTMTVGS